MFFTSYGLQEFQFTLYKKWSHDIHCRKHMIHIFEYMKKNKSIISIEVEIYASTSYKHDTDYVTELLKFKYYI